MPGPALYCLTPDTFKYILSRLDKHKLQAYTDRVLCVHLELLSVKTYQHHSALSKPTKLKNKGDGVACRNPNTYPMPVQPEWIIYSYGKDHHKFMRNTS